MPKNLADQLSSTTRGNSRKDRDTAYTVSVHGQHFECSLEGFAQVWWVCLRTGQVDHNMSDLHVAGHFGVRLDTSHANAFEDQEDWTKHDNKGKYGQSCDGIKPAPGQANVYDFPTHFSVNLTGILEQLWIAVNSYKPEQ